MDRRLGVPLTTAPTHYCSFEFLNNLGPSRIALTQWISKISYLFSSLCLTPFQSLCPKALRGSSRRRDSWHPGTIYYRENLQKCKMFSLFLVMLLWLISRPYPASPRPRHVYRDLVKNPSSSSRCFAVSFSGPSDALLLKIGNAINF